MVSISTCALVKENKFPSWSLSVFEISIFISRNIIIFSNYSNPLFEGHKGLAWILGPMVHDIRVSVRTRVHPVRYGIHCLLATYALPELRLA